VVVLIGVSRSFCDDGGVSWCGPFGGGRYWCHSFGWLQATNPKKAMVVIRWCPSVVVVHSSTATVVDVVVHSMVVNIWGDFPFYRSISLYWTPTGDFVCFSSWNFP